MRLTLAQQSQTMGQESNQGGRAWHLEAHPRAAAGLLQPCCGTDSAFLTACANHQTQILNRQCHPLDSAPQPPVPPIRLSSVTAYATHYTRPPAPPIRLSSLTATATHQGQTDQNQVYEGRNQRREKVMLVPTRASDAGDLGKASDAGDLGKGC